MNDPVNNPKHYTSGSIECIDAMLEIFGRDALCNFCLCNAFKYLWRNNLKNNSLEDIKKANWYLSKYISLKEYES